MWDRFWKRLLAALLFYTRLPIPLQSDLRFDQVSHVAPLVGVLIGVLLSLVNWVLALLGCPILIRSSLMVACWVWITGGLHLDGVMDAADGLAASQDLGKRLQVMADSTTGAFGVMAGVLVLLLKVSAVASLSIHPSLGLTLAMGWGRWGQLVAIAHYPYLKAEGKGAFHQNSRPGWTPILLNGLLLIALSMLPLIAGGNASVSRLLMLLSIVGGVSIALGVGFWFHRVLGGHTGDTYGATVEWTEALFLSIWSVLFGLRG